MNALLIIAHGSRRQSSNEEVKALANRVQSQLPEFDRVAHAFLELASPGIESAARALIEDKTLSITILPYFLVAGRHVAEDIPAIIDQLRGRFPQTEIKLLDYFGASNAIDELVVNQVRNHL